MVREEYWVTVLPEGPHTSSDPGSGKFRYGYPINVIFSPVLVVSPTKSDLITILQHASHRSQPQHHSMFKVRIVLF